MSNHSSKKKIFDIKIRQTAPKKEKEASRTASIIEDFEKLDESRIEKQLEKEIEDFEKKEEKRLRKDKPIKKRRPLTYKTYLLFILAAVLSTALIYSAIEFLPKAKIKITTKKTDWTYADSITATKDISQIDFNQKQIPAEVFLARKNFTFTFQTTGKKFIERKATGKIIIYNAYSSNSQPLVAGTRFEAPNGKIFRLTERIIVPGAQINKGKITPSSIEAAVIADKAGSEYNLGAVDHFSIPGFLGTPKYQGFYAESKQAMSGGFIGDTAYPTDEDIKKDKEKAEGDFKDYTDSYLSLQIPPDFKIIDSARNFSILKEEINSVADEHGNFTIFIDGQSSAIGFKESDLLSLIEQIAQKKLGEKFKIKSFQLEYGASQPDFKQGRISFALTFKGTFEEPIDIENFKNQLRNQNEKQLKNLISSFPNIQKATVSFWPFWVKKVPSNPKQINIEVE